MIMASTLTNTSLALANKIDYARLPVNNHQFIVYGMVDRKHWDYQYRIK